jgi:membrane-bound lytic murein transglycosylase B
LLGRIEHRFGVQRRFIVAIWGAETNYGTSTGDIPVLQALATLAWEPRRAAYFRGELFDALRIVARGDIDLASMRGSWAGAMGQPQFMPSSYLKYADDFDGDGRRDIWGSTPDALASIASYLRSTGWTRNETWGSEVSIPPAARARLRSLTGRTSGCNAIRTLTAQRPLRDWGNDGVRAVDGGPLPPLSTSASLVLTADARSFLVFRNYETLLAYNCSHHYALSVSLLADALS